MIRIPERCESCGKEIAPYGPAKTLEDNFVQDEQKRLGICRECFDKRFKVETKRRSGYGGTIYELEEKSAPRFGLGSKKFTCLKCNWYAWTEEGLRVHMEKRHKA
ncbi:hypothetical protein EU538_00610 [Candidatus Thorarchaeota archaeon]|nr:MAG: hypothetical protein EU538_00610 [Candidatus Thorarchaeota archaeon]